MKTTEPNVLIVDDNPHHVTAITAVLEGMPLRLHKATSGDEALRLVLTNDFAVILLDVAMPGIDGYETAKLIRGCHKGRHIPIVFLTAYYQTEQNQLEGYAEGAVDYLTKPVSPRILKAKVGVFLELFKRNQELQAEIRMRKQAHAALFQADSDYRQLVEKLPTGAYTCDAEGLITSFNERAVELWGRKPKLYDAADRYCGSFKLFAVDGSPIPHNDCWMARALLGNKEYNGQEILIERPDGTRRCGLAHANPVHDPRGNVIGAFNILVDITDRKKAEEALAEKNAELDGFNRLAVGRELRMIELKREVNALARAAGKPEPYDLSVVDQGEKAECCSSGCQSSTGQTHS